VLAQRLMRRICTTCREVSTTPPPERLRRYIPDGTQIVRPVGCPECSMTGYRGRFSVVEVLTMNTELEKLIGAGVTADKIAEAARANGMLSLFESGLRHVLAGETGVEELLRVVDVPVADGAVAGRLSIPSASPPKPPEAGPAAASAAPTAAPRRTPPSTPSPAVAAAPAAPAHHERPSRPVAPAADLSNAFELIEEEVVIEEPARRGGARGQTVLLVDDEEFLRRVMKDLLVREGYEVVEAGNGVEALDQTDRHAPDVIVLDLNLPGMDGYSVLAELRSRPATRNIPVVVLTAKGDEDNEVRVFELGADDFLTKPFRAKALSKRLEVVLGRRR
jgi:CheY-like chemotaxis protein